MTRNRNITPLFLELYLGKFPSVVSLRIHSLKYILHLYTLYPAYYISFENSYSGAYKNAFILSWPKFNKHLLTTIFVTNNMIVVFLDSHASGFKKCIDLGFFVCLFVLAVPHSMRDLSSPTKDRTHAPCSGSAES